MSDVLERVMPTMPAEVENEERTLRQHQVLLEQLYSKNQLIPRLTREFETSEVPFAASMTEAGIPLRFGFDLLVQMALHKRAALPVLVGLLRHHLNDSQQTADMLLKAAEADLVDWSPQLRVFIVKFQVSADVQEELDRFQYPLPMVVEPRPIQSNRDTGYLLRGAGSSVILRNNHHDDDVCLDHLNRMNSIRFTVNQDVVRMVKNQWKHLDRAKEGETYEEFQARQRAFEKYDRTAKDVMATLQRHSEHFYLTHRYDKRGRVYCQGYHLTYQGNSWNKACLELADKEVIE